ncbi:MAG TPA: hypothetical protein VK966_01695, partial [Longimicrobiales bacterium]|nr:hypothetical protein [Longimicrobiales bacterium]
YLERLRMGLGSPFRLLEYALLDPRLERSDRERLAWALLSATVDGDAYQIDPRVLAPGGDMTAATGHLELIEGAVSGAGAADGGALAVRLAYAMAAAEGSVPPRFSRYVARAAALVRDRVVAREDARRLLWAAGDSVDPLSLVTVWRVERKFEVERPALPAARGDVEREAVALAPRLVETIREIAARPRRGPLAEVHVPSYRPLIPEAAARLLAERSGILDLPPQTPVVVAVESHARSGAPTSGPQEAARDRFFASAVNEERLAAEYALLHYGTGADLAPRLAAMSAAVGLRGYAQERPWFPGFGGPTGRELEDRYGLAAVVFPDSVPAHWRPYFRRMLDTSLSDLQRVLPSLDVRGLTFRFGSRSGSPGTLAVHDPRTRTIHLPASTGAGTLAHEIAHDLDWQTALSRYAVRGDYGTDRAVRLEDERLASVLRGLTAASLSAAETPEHLRSHASRPAEVFARGVDWFVAVALAREGRINGYLSSIQDEVLTGYGTVTPPDITGRAGQSLMALLDEVAPVYPATRQWFLESYGRARPLSAWDLTRRMLETPLEGGEPGVGLEELVPARDIGDVDAVNEPLGLPVPTVTRLADALAALHDLASLRDQALAAVDGSCQVVATNTRAAGARRQLVRQVAEARARGIAMDAARDLMGPEGPVWLAERLAGRPVESAMAPAAGLPSGIGDEDGTVQDTGIGQDAVNNALAPLIRAVRRMGEDRVDARPLEVHPPAADCAHLPFPIS